MKINKIAPTTQVKKIKKTPSEVENIYKNLMDKMDEFDIRSESIHSEDEILPTPIADHGPQLEKLRNSV